MEGRIKALTFVYLDLGIKNGYITKKESEAKMLQLDSLFGMVIEKLNRMFMEEAEKIKPIEGWSGMEWYSFHGMICVNSLFPGYEEEKKPQRTRKLWRFSKNVPRSLDLNF